MPAPDPTERFASTEAYYAAYRPGYGDAAVDDLVDRFDVDASARVLDLGCGTGQLAVPLARRVGTVVGVDPNPRMLGFAQERAAEAGAEVAWVEGSDASLDGLRGPFRLTVMGRAFHWTDERATLDRLREITEPGGGVAIVTDEEWLTHGRDDWQARVYDVAARFVDELPAREHPDDLAYDDPWDEMLVERGYADVDTVTFPIEREWTVDEIVGYVLSLSFCSPAVLGDEQGAFEAELREEFAGEGPFVQHAEVEVLSGRVAN